MTSYTERLPLDDYFDRVIHTGHEAIPSLPDHTLEQVILKLMALRESPKMYLDRATLIPTIETSWGKYSFCIEDDSPTARLIIREVI